MASLNEIRQQVADIIAEERDEGGTMPGSASLAGLTDDEWTADRILKALRGHGLTLDMQP